jgi:GT2 family glycosyltransferase
MQNITILIVSHNHERYLNVLLQDINKFSKFINKIIILHNVLPKDKIFIPKKLKNKIFSIHNKKPLGLSRNINKSLKYCKSEFFAVINPDIRIKKNIFKNILKNFKKDKKLALVSPIILDESGRIQDTKRSYPSIVDLIKREIFMIKLINNGNDWLAGMFSIFKTSLLKKVKFDHNFFLYCEDVDISLRLKKKKYKFLLDQNNSVIHNGQKTSRKNLRFTFFHIKRYFYLWSKRGFF